MVDINLREEYNIEVSRPKGGYLDELPSYILENQDEYISSIKENGERITVQFNSDCDNIITGRNRENKLKGVAFAGKFQRKYKPAWLLNLKIPKELDGTLLDGELVGGGGRINKDGSSCKDAQDRFAQGKFVGYVVFDVLFKNREDGRLIDVRDVPLCIRVYDYLDEIIRKLDDPLIKKVEQYNFIDEKLIKRIFDRNEEGLVVKYKDSPYIPKTNQYWWKIKSDRTVDGFIVGCTEGKTGGSGVNGIKPVPSGFISTFDVAVLSEGNPITVAKVYNMPEISISEFEKYKNKVVEFSANQFIPNEFIGGRFIEPRFKKFRDDKNLEDCTWSSQIGKFVKEDKK